MKKGFLKRNYINENGVIGSYRDIDVYVIDEEDFTEDKKNEVYRIYAVRKKNSSIMILVHNGLIIGTMDKRGLVQRTEVQKAYQFKSKKEKPVVKENNPEVPAEPEDIIFSNYTKVVDDFFGGLHELWKEMEV